MYPLGKELYRIFANNVKYYRTKAKIESKELSKRLGLAEDYIDNLESCNLEKIEIGIALRIAYELNVKIDALATEKRDD